MGKKERSAALHRHALGSMGKACRDLASFPCPFYMNHWMPSLAFWCEQRASYFQAKPKIQHWDGTEGLGRYMLWTCPKFSVRYFTLLWETCSVSSLVSKATCIIVNTAGCVYLPARRQVEESQSFQHLHILILLDRDGLMWSVSWQLTPAHAVPQPKPAHVDRAAGCN